MGQQVKSSTFLSSDGTVINFVASTGVAFTFSETAKVTTISIALTGISRGVTGATGHTGATGG